MRCEDYPSQFIFDLLKVSSPSPHKYQPSSGQSLSLLMKASHLRLKLVESFFVSFNTDNQSNFNVSNTHPSRHDESIGHIELIFHVDIEGAFVQNMKFL